MKVLLPVQLRRLGTTRPAPTVEVTAIDFSRPFIPEQFTQLYYTPYYEQLTLRQRLRYNQLFAIRVNEQFMFFESDFTNRILAKLLAHPAILADTDLAACLAQMIQEEKVHHALFWALNQRCLPGVYAHTDRYFTRLRWQERMALRLATAFPRYLTFLLWFIIALEEYSTGLSRAMIKQPETESLGPLETNFIAVHAAHLQDEARHVHIDINLIQNCLALSGKVWRRLNAGLFQAFIRDIIVPKRSGLAVLKYFLQEQEELQPLAPALLASVRSLQQDERFQRSLFNRELMPYTFALFDEQPEFHALGRVMRGYQRSERGSRR